MEKVIKLIEQRRKLKKDLELVKQGSLKQIKDIKGKRNLIAILEWGLELNKNEISSEVIRIIDEEVIL